jgi:hypothetical protein
VAILAAALGSNAQGAPINYQFELEALHSDNINLCEDKQASESVFIPRLLFDVNEEGAAIELQARGEIERRFYTGNEFDDETRGEFAGQLSWSLLPQRLSLVFEDYLTDEPINFRDGRYPGNLQQVNVFLAGPSFYARMGDATRFQLDLRAADTYAEVAPDFNGERYAAAAALQRDLTPTTTGSLNFVTTKAEFDEPVFTSDYTRNDAFARLQGTLRDIDYELDLGYTRLDRDAGDHPSTAMGRLQVEWQATAHSRLRLRARHQFADQVQDMIVRLRDPTDYLIPDLVDSSSSLVSAGVYKRRDVEIAYRFEGERFGLRLTPMYRRLRYLDRTDADRTESGAFFEASYRLQPTMSLTFNGTVRDREFLNRVQEDRDHTYSLGLEHQLTRHWGWRAEAMRNERSSNIPDQEYTENAVLLTAWWRR